jgi:RHS repeat-associated protein
MTDDITGLQWNINRWYDAQVGIWISEDPIGLINDINLFKYVHNIPMLFADFLGLESSSPCTSQSGQNETCQQIAGPPSEMEETRTYIGDKYSYYYAAYMPYYKSAKWVSEGFSVTSNCSQELNATISTLIGQEVTYSLGGLVNVGSELFEISGTVAFSSSTGQTWTQNFSKAAKQCRYYKGYLARLKVTIEYYHPAKIIVTIPPTSTILPPGYATDKILYLNTGTYICECTCSN